jgi:hypothetical protein
MYVLGSVYFSIGYITCMAILNTDRKQMFDCVKYEQRSTYTEAFSNTFLNARFLPVDRWIDIEYVRVSGSPTQNVSGIQGTRTPFHQRTAGHVHIESSEYYCLLFPLGVFGQLSITRVTCDFRNTYYWFTEGVNKLHIYCTYVYRVNISAILTKLLSPFILHMWRIGQTDRFDWHRTCDRQITKLDLYTYECYIGKLYADKISVSLNEYVSKQV